MLYEVITILLRVDDRVDLDVGPVVDCEHLHREDHHDRDDHARDQQLDDRESRVPRHRLGSFPVVANAREGDRAVFAALFGPADGDVDRARERRLEIRDLVRDVVGPLVARGAFELDRVLGGWVRDEAAGVGDRRSYNFV